MFAWFDNHPTKAILLYTIVIGGSVFAFSKFVLIENVEREKNTQLETKDVIIMQYKSKINYLETENSDLQAEIDKYLEWLRNTPGTLQYVENKNEKLENEIDNLKKQISAIDNGAKNELYKKEYNAINGNEAIVDEKTNVVIAVNDISYEHKGVLSVSIPQKDDILKKMLGLALQWNSS